MLQECRPWVRPEGNGGENNAERGPHGCKEKAFIREITAMAQ